MSTATFTISELKECLEDVKALLTIEHKAWPIVSIAQAMADHLRADEVEFASVLEAAFNRRLNMMQFGREIKREYALFLLGKQRTKFRTARYLGITVQGLNNILTD